MSHTYDFGRCYVDTNAATAYVQTIYHCSKCGKLLRDFSFRYCPYCGTRFEDR